MEELTREAVEVGAWKLLEGLADGPVPGDPDGADATRRYLEELREVSMRTYEEKVLAVGRAAEEAVFKVTSATRRAAEERDLAYRELCISIRASEVFEEQMEVAMERERMGRVRELCGDTMSWVPDGMTVEGRDGETAEVFVSGRYVRSACRDWQVAVYDGNRERCFWTLDELDDASVVVDYLRAVGFRWLDEGQPARLARAMQELFVDGEAA